MNPTYAKYTFCRGVMGVLGVYSTTYARENKNDFSHIRGCEQTPETRITPRRSDRSDSDAVSSLQVALIVLLMVVLFFAALRYVLEVMA